MLRVSVYFHSSQVIVECMQRGVVPAPAAVASGEYGDDLMEGTADNGPVEKEDVKVWEDEEK